MQLKRTTHHRQFYRYLAGALIGCIACAAPSSAQNPAKIHFRLQTREVVEGRLKSFSIKNSEREALIRKWFAESGCKAANLSEQALDRKLPPNVICVLPGETQQVILVGAHTDKVDGVGDGVVENWTGAVLLPALLDSLGGQLRHHTQLPAQAIEEGGQQYGSCPVFDHSVPNAVDLIGVCADQNNLLRFARQHANNVRWKLAVKRLLREIRGLASRLSDPFPNQRFAFAVFG